MAPKPPPSHVRWPPTHHSLRRSLLMALALVTLAGAIAANIVLWPIEQLGFDVDPLTGVVVQVTPGSAAAEAGLRESERVLEIYDLPLQAVLSHWNLGTLIQHNPATVAVTVLRDGAAVELQLPRRAPTPDTQRAKVVFALLAAICWITGYLLGLVRRHQVSATWLVSAFWLLLGGILGTYIFAVDLSLPLLAVLLWLLLTIVPGLCVAIHVWFPARTLTPRQQQLARWGLVAGWLISNLALALVVLSWRPSLVELLLMAWTPLFILLALSFLASGLILVSVYRRIGITHVRRQIRLIAGACLITATVWIALRLVPLLLDVPPPIPDALIDLVPILIPLAYLVSGRMLNLYAIDRLVQRLIAVTLSAALMFVGGSVLVVGAQPLRLDVALWSAASAGLLFVPLARGLRRLLAPRSDPDRSYVPLRRARQELATSLAPDKLGAALLDGIQATFHRAPVALYQVSLDEAPVLRLTHQVGMPDLPAMLPDGTVQALLCSCEPIIEALAIHQRFATTQLQPEEEAAVRHQGIALWCPIRQSSEKLLGLLLLGSAGDLDPYRARDLGEIRELTDAAALAFANSAAYEQLRVAEATLRKLLHVMRQVEDATAAALAREIHDDILNVSVQLNILALLRMLKVETDTARRAKLELLLDREQSVSEALRTICARLHPTALDDPYGLPALLRGLVQRVEEQWPGSCELVVQGEACALASDAQRELFRIAREALANAVKHAQATTIAVQLIYPHTDEQTLTLRISDDGQGGQKIEPKRNHWGLRNMMESATAIQGDLRWLSAPGGGTEVILRMPLTPQAELPPDSLMPTADADPEEDALCSTAHPHRVRPSP